MRKTDFGDELRETFGEIFCESLNLVTNFGTNLAPYFSPKIARYYRAVVYFKPIEPSSSKIYTSDEAQFQVAFTILKLEATIPKIYRPEEISEYLTVTALQTNNTYNEISGRK